MSELTKSQVLRLKMMASPLTEEGILADAILTLNRFAKEKSLDDQVKQLEDFKPRYACRIHPTSSFHEVGCSHMSWTAIQLQEALDMAKISNAYLSYKITEDLRNE